MAKAKKPDKDDITRDYSLMNSINNHIHVFGFASAVDNLFAACEDKVARWNQRLAKAKKIRDIHGKPTGRN